MNGDNVVCELCPGVWLDGVVQGTPKASAWPSLPRIGMPAHVPTPAASLVTAPPPAAEPDPFLMSFSSRVRKKPEMYDASLTTPSTLARFGRRKSTRRRCASRAWR